MEAGRLGGYGDREFSVGQSEIDASRKNEYSLDRLRDGDHGLSRGRDLRDGVRERPKDEVKKDSFSEKKEYWNGYRRSPLSNSSGGSGDDGRKRLHHGRLVDREPGELSSGSGSDEGELPMPTISDTRTNCKQNGHQLASDNGSQGKHDGVFVSRGSRIKESVMEPSPSKKRKFSPIVWDKDEDKQPKVIAPRSRKDSPVSATLPPPSLLGRSHARPDTVELVQEPLEQASPLDVKVFLDSPHDQQLGDERDQQQMEDDGDDFPTTRNISSSRWADEKSALDNDDDEVDAYNEELVVSRKKNAPKASMLDQLDCKKVRIPEFGEVVMRESAEGATFISSDSLGEQEDEQEVEVDGNMYMEIDGEVGVEDGSDRLSDTDTEPEDNRARTPEPALPYQRCINMLQGCRSVDEFERLNRIDEGTYGVVYRAKDRKSGEVVALKKVKMEKEREGFPLTSLREINIILSFHHPSIVEVKEVVVGSSLDSIFMVMEYMEHDLKGLLETMKQPFSQSEVKCLMLQLLEGMKYLHDNWVLHRDLKTSNLLFNNRGELKICDFGLARQYGSPLKPYTQLVVTLWYRAPELLLGAKEYSTAIDMWSLGCIMAELLSKEPLFNGKTELDQLDKIFRTLGTPNEITWPGISKLPGYKPKFVNHPCNRLREKFPPTSFSGRPTLSEAGFDLLKKLLTYDPEKRLTAEAALKHAWFGEVPLPKSKDFMPTFPAQHVQDRRSRRIMKSPDPLAELYQKEKQQGNLGTGSIIG